MSEEWRPITSANGNYLVSNHGRVMNGKTGKILKPRPLPNGYLRVHIASSGGGRDKYVHRLVAEAFCIHPKDCNVVNHKDNNPANNHWTNIEWTTQRGNVIYAMKQGRVLRFPNAIPVVGTKDGKTYTFRSSSEASEKTGCNVKSILKCCRHIFKSSKGYHWEFGEVI